MKFRNGDCRKEIASPAGAGEAFEVNSC